MESSVQIVVNGISMNVSTPLHVQDCFGPRPATDTPVLLYDITACKQQMKALNRRWVQLRVACARASQSLEVLRPEVERCRSRVRRHQMDQADLDKVREEVDQIMKARATAWRELRELRKARRAPGVLLLPHPEHGTVMVLDSHHYQLVRFVGEELILVGLQGGNRAMADAGSSEEVPEEEEQEGGALMEETVATECRAVELFLRHRNKEVSEADFFRLAPEEQADFMQVARNLRRKERVNRGEVRGRFGDD